MTKPFICPICKGRGEILRSKAKYDARPLKTITLKNGKTQDIFSCHGCIGTGIMGINPFITSAPYIIDQKGITYGPQWTISSNDAIITNEKI